MVMLVSDAGNRYDYTVNSVATYFDCIFQITACKLLLGKKDETVEFGQQNRYITEQHRTERYRTEVVTRVACEVLHTCKQQLKLPHQSPHCTTMPPRRPTAARSSLKRKEAPASSATAETSPEPGGGESDEAGGAAQGAAQLAVDSDAGGQLDGAQPTAVWWQERAAAHQASEGRV